MPTEPTAPRSRAAACGGPASGPERALARARPKAAEPARGLPPSSLPPLAGSFRRRQAPAVEPAQSPVRPLAQQVLERGAGTHEQPGGIAEQEAVQAGHGGLRQVAGP